MEIFYTRAGIGRYLEKLKEEGRSIGLVPTMGALHAGHLSLLDTARTMADISVCSIFVNPTQFNDKRDLENYPRPQDEDIRKLRDAGCAVLFLPSVDEMYDRHESWHIDLGNMDKVLEGKVRPGHYQGVTQIVNKLFETVRPHFAFFGQKDYQQFLIISYMVKKLNIPVELIRCPIIREESGLAMSSRNIYLSEAEKQQALALYKALNRAKSDFDHYTIPELKSRITAMLNDSPGVQPEYFELVNAATLEPLKDKQAESIIALVAARVGKIRIIDNMILK